MKQFLPIGSVVLLEGGDKRLMIYGIMQVNSNDNKQYDYIGCIYPEGYIGTEHNYLFNNEDIQKTEFIGFVDGEQQAFRIRLTEFLKSQKENEEND